LSRITVIKLLLEDAGIDPDRVTIEWVSGAEGPRFARKVTEFTDKIRILGPNMLTAHKKEEIPCP